MSVSTVVTMRPAATVFREEQYFDWRVYALIAAFELVAGYCLVWVTRHWDPVDALLAHRWSIEFSLGLLVALALPLLMAACLLHMTTEVTPTEVRVWFGWVPIYRRVVMITGIQRYQRRRVPADHRLRRLGHPDRPRRRARAQRPRQSGRPARAGRRLEALDRQPALRGTRRNHRTCPPPRRRLSQRR